MGNCLVTKLKGSVDANLPIFNSLTFELAESNGNSALDFGGGSKATIVGNAHFNDGTDKTIFSNYFYVRDASNGDILNVFNKYDITYIKCPDVIDGRNFKENSTIDLSYCSNITYLEINKWNTNVNLDLNKFSETNTAIYRIRYHGNPKLTGDLEYICEHMIAAGRTNGGANPNTLKILADNSGIRLNGRKFMTGIKQYICISFNSPTDVQINQAEDGSGELLASWNGSSWTYYINNN